MEKRHVLSIVAGAVFSTSALVGGMFSSDAMAISCQQSAMADYNRQLAECSRIPVHIGRQQCEAAAESSYQQALRDCSNGGSRQQCRNDAYADHSRGSAECSRIPDFNGRRQCQQYYDNKLAQDLANCG